MIRNGGERVKHTGYTTDIVTDLALDWLKGGRDQEKPFMLMYQHKAPHRNWMPGPKHLTMYDDVTIPEPDTLDDYAGRGTAAKTQRMEIKTDLNANDLKLTQPRGLTPEQLSAWNAAYEPKNEAFRQANLQGDDLIRWKYQRYIKDYSAASPRSMTTSGACSPTSTRPGWRTTPWSSTPPTRAGISEKTAGSISAGSTTSRCACHLSSNGPARRSPAARTPTWSRTSISPRPSSRWRVPRSPVTCRGAASSRS
ncbi:MAG: hypothetical protein R3F11_11170 [Verrucomicrobiales bacterium]